MQRGKQAIDARSMDGLTALHVELRIPIQEMSFWHPKRIEQLFWGISQAIEAAGRDWKPPEEKTGGGGMTSA